MWWWSRSRRPSRARAVKKKDIYKAVVVRQKKAFRRASGIYVRFDDNAVVLIEKQGKEMGPKGNRVFGPVPRDLVERGWQNIASHRAGSRVTILTMSKLTAGKQDAKVQDKERRPGRGDFRQG